MSKKFLVLNRRGRKRAKKQALRRRRVHRSKLTCPDHACDLVSWHTQFGVRWNCPEAGCTVACWDNHTSSPADTKTRAQRKACHAAFDALWKNGGWSRDTAYSSLATYMQLSPKACHIGMFDSEQCERARLWSEAVINSTAYPR